MKVKIGIEMTNGTKLSELKKAGLTTEFVERVYREEFEKFVKDYWSYDDFIVSVETEYYE